MVQPQCPCIRENEVNVVKYIAETSKRLVNRFMEHFSSKQISPLAAILLPRVTKQTVLTRESQRIQAKLR